MLFFSADDQMTSRLGGVNYIGNIGEGYLVNSYFSGWVEAT